MSTRALTPAVYRPYRLLAAAMGAAAAFWAYALYFLWGFADVPWKTLATAGTFTVFFLLACLYYGRSAFFVDEQGFTYRGMLRTTRFRFADVREVRILPGPLTVYSVSTKEFLGDENGNVKYPNVNSLVEMTDMREAQRSYEANLNIISATRRMIQRTLDILKA